MSPQRSTLRTSVPAALGIAACAACCTLPFVLPVLASAGLGSALLTWATNRSDILGVALLGIGGTAVGFQWWRSRRAESGCTTDGSCGCHPDVKK